MEVVHREIGEFIQLLKLSRQSEGSKSAHIQGVNR